MTKFAEKGLAMQVRSRSSFEAERNMSFSCRCCGEGSGNLNCQSCPIAMAHTAVLKVFEMFGECNQSAATLFERNATGINPIDPTVLGFA